MDSLPISLSFLRQKDSLLMTPRPNLCQACQYNLQVIQSPSVISNTVTIKRAHCYITRIQSSQIAKTLLYYYHHFTIIWGVSHRPALKTIPALLSSVSHFLLVSLSLKHQLQLPSWIAQPAYEPAQLLLTNLHPHSTTPHVKSWEEDICHRHGRR